MAWTRFTPGNNDTYWIWIVSSDGSWAGTGSDTFDQFSGQKGVGNYSDQVYSPGDAVAYVLDVSTDQEACFNQDGIKNDCPFLCYVSQ
jgi:hypothetical protein